MQAKKLQAEKTAVFVPFRKEAFGWLLAACMLAAGGLLANASGGVAGEAAADPFLWSDDQVGLVLELQQPAPAVRSFFRGPLGSRVAQLPPVRRWWAKQQASVRAVFVQVAQQLGFSPQELEQVALQRRLTLLLWPPDSPGQDGKLLLLIDCGQSEQARRLERGLRRVFQPDPSSWEPMQEEQHSFWLYRESPRKRAPETTVVGTLGGFVAVSNDLETYRRVLGRYRNSGNREGTLAAMPAFLEARAGRLPQTVLWLFVNLPVWERSIRQEKHLLEKQNAAAETEKLLRIWPALRYLALGIRAEEHVLCYGQLAYRRERLPAELALRLEVLEGASEGFSHLPRDVIAAATIRLDLHRLLRIVFRESNRRRLQTSSQKQPAPQAEEALPRPIQTALLALCSLTRPDQTLALVAYRDQQEILRMGWTVAVGLKEHWPGADTSTTPEEALAQVLPGLASLFGSLVLERQVLYRATRTATGWIVFRPVAPAGTPPLTPEEPLPVFAAAGGHFWAASSVEVLERSWQSARETTLAEHPCWLVLQGAVPEPHHRLFVSLESLRGLLRDRPMAVPELLEPEANHDPAQVARAAARVADLLSVADCVAATARVTSREIRFALIVMVRQQAASAPAPGR